MCSNPNGMAPPIRLLRRHRSVRQQTYITRAADENGHANECTATFTAAAKPVTADRDRTATRSIRSSNSDVRLRDRLRSWDSRFPKQDKLGCGLN